MNTSAAIEWIRKAADQGFHCTCDICCKQNGHPQGEGKVDLPNEITEAIAKKICTFTLTGEKKKPQAWFECAQCGLRGTLGVCVVCKENCHKAHQLVSNSPNFDPFICSCGWSGNKWCSSHLDEENQAK